jgi:tetratricopeptide (TPR) repeat protein
MATSKSRIIVPLLLAASIAHTAYGQVPTSGKDPLGAARDLYASARYDEALAVLNDLRPTDAANSPSDRRSIEQYRSLCLLALGRGQEAESAIAAVVTADPTYQPNETDASPRVRAAFSDVRRRLLPEIVTTRYAAAKQSFDRKDYQIAEQMFREVIALLNDPDMGGRLSDLRTLSSGFLDLSVAAAAPPPEPVKKEAASAPPPPPAAPQPDPNRIYTVDDRDVTAPQAVRQDVPRIPPNLALQAHERGVLEVVIDERGRVITMNIRMSVHPMYDTLLMTSARDWRYQPATLNGKPVKYRKLIQINVTKSD